MKRAVTRQAYLQDLERKRLLTLEHRARARAESCAVHSGILETVDLAQARGSEFIAPKVGRGERDKPYKRQTGLDWLVMKGKISEEDKFAGERYGGYYRAARAMTAVRSGLGDGQGLERDPVWAGLEAAERRIYAQGKLQDLRALLNGEPNMIRACDLVCGEELTPREVSPKDIDVARLEAVLSCALNFLAATSRPA